MNALPGTEMKEKAHPYLKQPDKSSCFDFLVPACLIHRHM